MSYQGKVYRKQDGDQLVVASGGEINVESGGKITAGGTQAAVIADIAITYSSNDPSITPDGSITIANGSTPTVAELLEFCEELNAKINALTDAVQGAGIVATS